MNMVYPYLITSDCIETYFGLEDIWWKGRAEKKKSKSIILQESYNEMLTT